MIYGWVSAMVYEEDDPPHFHIIPVDDLRKHNPFPECWCCPTEDEEDPGIWVHHALDRREEHELGRMKH